MKKNLCAKGSSLEGERSGHYVKTGNLEGVIGSFEAKECSIEAKKIDSNRIKGDSFEIDGIIKVKTKSWS